MDLKKRTKKYAPRIVRLYSGLPKSMEVQVIGKRLLRAGTSVGAHYCEATRARSAAEFVSKIDVGLQELEESAYWIELLVEVNLVPAKRLADIHNEPEELTAILVACSKSVKNQK